MRLPRDLGGDDLVKSLRRLGYEPTRQTGSHIRLTRATGEDEHHITIPRHKSLRVGTLNAILHEISGHLGIDKAQLVQEILR